MAKKRKSPPKSPRLPSYCLHRASGQAYVKIRGKVTYLGVHGTETSRVAYAAVVADVLAGRELTAQSPRASKASSARMTVGEVCERYVSHAKGYYVKGGEPTTEVGIIAVACGYASDLYGDQLAESFGPLALESVRDRMIEAELARTTINGLVSRICRAFKWAAGKEHIPATVPSALATVAGLRAGRSVARETAPILPVADEAIEATIRELPSVVADMVRVQRLTGMRPGEVCSLRPIDLDRSDEVWVYRPATHKTEHHGRERAVFVGPLAQAVLLRYLARDAKTPCFTPSDSEAKRRALRHAMRQTPMSCGSRPITSGEASELSQADSSYSVAVIGRRFVALAIGRGSSVGGRISCVTRPRRRCGRSLGSRLRR